jgi:uncharacterized protein (TIGR02646 family)
MIQLEFKQLDANEQNILTNLQAVVDKETTFEMKASKAADLWETKGSAAGKRSFKVIANTLSEMCVFVNVCNYCEQSEANDIEHIFPKSFFTHSAFLWENYILACKQCNSGHKLDKGFVLDGGNDLVALKRGIEPPFPTIAFINIRTEDPNDFMILNPTTFKFDILDNLSKADYNKADATLSILELNTRSTLLEARKSAARHYYEMLERLIRIKESKSIEELQGVLNPLDDKFDFTKQLEDIKSEIIENFRIYISTYQHPSVWHSIKRIQSHIHPKWKIIFDSIPEAASW